MISDEIFYRLRATVETKNTWWIRILPLFVNKPYFGEVRRDIFRISRITWWYHNFTPVVSRKIQSEGLGCCLQVRMRMRWLSFLFSAFWLGAVWVMYFGGMANLIIQKIQTGTWQIESPWLLLPGIVMFALGYLISLGSFKNEANRVKEFLLTLSNSNEQNVIYCDQLLEIKESQIIQSLFLVTFVVSIAWIVFNLLR